MPKVIPQEYKQKESEEFCKGVEELVEKYSMQYIDAVVTQAERNNIDMDTAATLVTVVIKDKVRDEAMNLHMLRKVPSLPM